MGTDSTLQAQPANAIRKACAKEGIDPADLDLVEINEAFASVALASTKDLGIDPEKVNVNGGAIATGHPIGMSGARLVLHLALELKRRDYGIGAQILSDLGVKTMRLLTNNPRKFVGLQGYGLSVSEAVPLEIPASDHTRRYLKTKKDKLGHKLSSV